MNRIFYPEDIIEEIKNRNDIVDVISEYVKLEKKGKDYFGLCPFHREKTPSFSVAPSKQIFYCFGCGKGGNVIHYIMSIENLDYKDAIRFLADRAGIDLPEGGERKDTEKARLRKKILRINIESARYFFNCLNSKDGAAGREFFRERGIKESVIRSFGLGYASESWDGLYKHLLTRGFKETSIEAGGLVIKNKQGGFYDRFRGRVIFPIFDVRGNIIGFGGRVTDHSLPKYMNSPETPFYSKGKHLYALNFAKNAIDKGRLIIVEGYMDVISLHQNGIINTVASLGTAMTENQGRLLMRYAEEVLIAYDADTAGQKAAMRSLDLLNSMRCSVKVLNIPEGKDPDDFIRTNGTDRFRKLIDNALSFIEYKIEILKREIDTGTTDGKIRFLNSAADVLSKVDNNVEREMYIKKMAKDYRITEQAIFAEVLKRTGSKTGYAGRKIKYSIKKDAVLGSGKHTIDERLIYDERLILVLLCVDNSTYRHIKDKLDPGSFTSGENRRIAETVINRLETGGSIEPGELLNMVSNETAGAFSKLIKEESHCDDIKKAIVGKISNMEAIKSERRIKEITELLENRSELEEGVVGKLEQELKLLMLNIKKRKNI